jgi:hypothetical protein
MAENEFDDADENNLIIIGEFNRGKYLEVIGYKNAYQNIDYIGLQFTFKYQDTAEGIVRLLVKSFGWEERGREGPIQVPSNKKELPPFTVWRIWVEKLGAIK